MTPRITRAGRSALVALLTLACAFGVAAQDREQEHWDPEAKGHSTHRRFGGDDSSRSGETTGEPGWTERHSLTNHFFGLGRPAEGVAIDLIYVADVMGNYRGGLRKRIEYLDRTDLLLTIDTAPTFGLAGGTLFADVMAVSGGDPSRQNIGDAQVASNLEAFNTIKLFEAWYEQALGSGLSLRVGLQDLNVEFDANETGALFVNSSHGIGPDFAQSGVNGPSIFPTTALGARAAWKASEALTLRAIALDAVAGDPGEPRRTQISLQRDDGVLVAAEADLSIGGVRINAGAWGYSRPFADVLDVDGFGQPVQRRGNQGFYALVEGPLFKEQADGEQGLRGFVRAGWADDRFNTVGSYLGAGLVYTGLMPRRDKDEIGVAIAAAQVGDDTRNAVRGSGGRIEHREVNLEMTYRAWLTPWCAVQPNVQVIFDPGFDPSLSNAVVVGIRFEVVL